MHILVIVTPTPGFESDTTRCQVIQGELERRLAAPLAATFEAVSYLREVEHFISAADLVLMYFHQSWLSKPKHPTTLDGFDILEYLSKAEKRYVVLTQSNMGRRHERIADNAHVLSFDEGSLDELMAKIVLFATKE